MAKIKDRRKNLKNDTQDFFDDDFEVTMKMIWMIF